MTTRKPLLGTDTELCAHCSIGHAAVTIKRSVQSKVKPSRANGGTYRLCTMCFNRAGDIARRDGSLPDWVREL